MAMAKKTAKRKGAKKKVARRKAVRRPKPKDVKRPDFTVLRERVYQRAIEKIARRLANSHGSTYTAVLGELLEGGDGNKQGKCVECGEQVNERGKCTTRGCERKISRDVYLRLSR